MKSEHLTYFIVAFFLLVMVVNPVIGTVGGIIAMAIKVALENNKETVRAKEQKENEMEEYQEENRKKYINEVPEIMELISDFQASEQNSPFTYSIEKVCGKNIPEWKDISSENQKKIVEMSRKISAYE